MQASASACRGRCSSSTRELNDCRRAGRAAPRPYNAYNALFVSPLTNLRWYDILIFYGILSYFVQSRNRAIPHNSKCRYGERGAADAKPKAQIILDAAKVSAASGGNSEPKHDAGTATRHYRAFWQRRCRAAAAGAVLKPQGGNCAVLPKESCRWAAAQILTCKMSQP